MSGLVRYAPDRNGTADLMNGPGVTAYVQGATNAALEYAQSIAPVSNSETGGTYKNSLVSETATELLSKQSRPVGYVRTQVDYAYAVEARHHVLARTADFVEAGS